MDVSKMGMELADASDQEPAEEASGGVDHESGKAAMSQLIEALKSGNAEEAWHAFQGAMACAGCDLGDGAQDGAAPEGAPPDEGEDTEE
jgi:hypothetical protein